MITPSAFRDRVAALIAELDEVLPGSDYEPGNASPAAIEMTRLGAEEPIRTVIGQASLLNESGADHILAAIKALTEPIQTFAMFTCIRTAMEVAALSCWILEPSIDHVERVSRSVAFRRKGLDEQSKLLRDTPETDGSRLNERYAQIEERIRELRLTRPQVPSATELVSRTFGKPLPYRLGSAVVHGHSWALLQVGLEPMGRDAKTKTTLLRPVVKPTVMLYFLAQALESLAKPAWAFGLYVGLDHAAIEERLTNAYDDVQFSGRRFWVSATG